MYRCLVGALAIAACSSSGARHPTQTSTPRAGVQLGDLDRAADPCTDFYQFANGAWRASHPIPAAMDRWSRRWAAGETNKRRLTEILEGIAQRTDWPVHSIDQQVGDFYASCMDDKAVDAAGATPLAPQLAEIDAIQTPGDLQRVIRKLAAQGVAVPFVVGSAPDLHDPRRTIASVMAGGLGMPDRDYYSKPEARFVETRDKYKAHVARVFVLLGRSEADAKAAAATVFDFESRLAAATLDNVARRDPKNLDHPSGFEGLAKAAPHVAWPAYFDDLKVAHGDLNIEQPGFLAAVDHEVVATPVATWRTYLAWQLADAALPWLSKPFVDEWFEFDRKFLGGIAEPKPRSMRCAELADQLLGEAVGQKYVERYFPPAAKQRALELVRNELSAMKEIITELTWMSDTTKQRALAKLATVNPKIGYPDRWKDYSSVEITRASLWGNIVAGRRFAVADDVRLIGKPTDRGRWDMTPPTSDAYYNPMLNEIVFPAGILQPPAFDVAASDASNYGAIGVVIGHEISHGFDDEGAQFDGDGRLSNWWTPEDLQRFQQRGQCVVDQFEGYFIEPGIHHNGKLVLGESIGDLGGVRIAYRAFENAHRAHPEPPAPGLTPSQEFFVAWGQFRGDETRPETQRRMVQGDPHPIAKFRVLGPFSNLPAFAQAFSCPSTAAMVRPAANRCEVW